MAETGIGHKLRGVAGRYVNLSDEHIKEAFQDMFHRQAVRAAAVAEKDNEKRTGENLLYFWRCSGLSKLLKRLVRGAGFEPARRFRH